MAKTVPGSSSDGNGTSGRRRGGRPSKRGQIESAAREVFGRVGFADATMDSISAEAQVSTRTLYQHFASKDDLFAAVLVASASQVAADFALGARHAASLGDPRSVLVELGRVFAGQGATHSEHFAMVNQLRARAVRLSDGQTSQWHDAGPYRVRGEVASVIDALARSGALSVPDVTLATLHFIALVTAEATIRPFAADGMPDDRVQPTVEAGVDAFLRAYGTGS